MVLPHPAIAGYAVAAGAWVVGILAGVVPLPTDAINWMTHLDRYSQTYSSGQGMYYAPPVYQAMSVLAWFGPQVFGAVMVGLGLAALGWIGGKWAWALLFFPPVWWDLSAGNINTILGAATVAMLLRPGWVGVPLLTKVTPAVTGLWWIIRGEWHAVARAAPVVGAVCAVSFVLDPGLWPAWFGALGRSQGYLGPGYFTIPVPLAPRLILAALIVIWAAKKDRPRLLPLAATVAMPVLWWSTLACLVAVLRRPEVQLQVPATAMEPSPEPDDDRHAFAIGSPR